MLVHIYDNALMWLNSAAASCFKLLTGLQIQALRHLTADHTWLDQRSDAQEAGLLNLACLTMQLKTQLMPSFTTSDQVKAYFL